MNEYQVALIAVQDAFKGLTNLPIGIHGFGGNPPNIQAGSNSNYFSLTGQAGYPYVHDTKQLLAVYEHAAATVTAEAQTCISTAVIESYNYACDQL